MSDEKATEFEAAFLEGADGEGQPVADATGRPAEGGGDGGQGDGGEDRADPERAADGGEPAKDPAERAAEVDETTDEFAGLSADELRERLKATAAEVASEKSLRTKAENALRSNEGRYSRAERDALELRRQLEAVTPKEEARQEAPTVDDATLDRIATEYDDLGKPLVEAFRGLQAEVTRLNEAASKATQADKDEAQRRLESFVVEQQNALTEAHPDWNEIVKAPAYAEWAVAQPAWVQDLIRRNGNQLVDGEAAVEVFNRFKADTAPPSDPNADRRRQQLEGSRHIDARRPAMEAKPTGGGSFDDEWARAADEDKRKAGAKR